MTRVMIDVDDTIAETQRLFIDRINPLTDNKYSFEGMTRRHRENAPEHKEWNDHVHRILKVPEEVALVEPSPGAYWAMRDLDKHRVLSDITTARKAPLFNCTDLWLKQHGFWPFVNDIHRRQDGERSVEFKVRVAKSFDFTAAFDDTADVVEALSVVVPVVYLIDKPWNSDTDFASNVIRVTSFAEGVEHLLNS